MPGSPDRRTWVVQDQVAPERVSGTFSSFEISTLATASSTVATRMYRKSSAWREKGLNCYDGALITDEIFDAYLKCKTKAHLTFGPATGGESSHPISSWQQHLADNYQANCRDRLQPTDSADCFVGNPRSEDLKSAKYRLIIQPYVTAQDIGSNRSEERRVGKECRSRWSP